MTAAKAKAPRYVAGSSIGVRVTLTNEFPMKPGDNFPYFLGELDGMHILYHCLAVEYVAAIRRGLAEHGTVLHDAPSAWMTVVPTKPIPDELVQLRDAVRAGRAGGSKDGAK